MRKLINRILIKLGLVKPKKVGWKWYGGYGIIKNPDDWIILGDIRSE